MRSSAFILSFLFFLVVVFTPVVLAQTTLTPVYSAKVYALSDQGIALRGIDAVFINPASIGFEEFFSIMITGETRFVSSGIQGVNIVGGIPFKSQHGTLGFGLKYYGVPEFNSQSYSLGYGRKLFKYLALGSAIEYNTTHIDQQHPSNIGLILVGVQWDATSRLRVGAGINLPFTVNSRVNEKLTSGWRIGCLYKISDLVHGYTELEKNDWIPWYFKAALEYQMLPAVSLRVGATTGISSFTSGIGLKISPSFFVDLTAVFYQYVGMSPSVSLRYHLNSKPTIE